jgi:hypothetical protein
VAGALPRAQLTFHAASWQFAEEMGAHSTDGFLAMEVWYRRKPTICSGFCSSAFGANIC